MKELIELMGKGTAKGATTPASRDTGKSMRNAQDELDPERAALFRQAAGTGLYVAQDRPSIQFAMHDIMSGMQKPLELHWAKLHRLARYLVQYPEEDWLYHYQELPDRLVVYADSDWAADTGDPEERVLYGGAVRPPLTRHDSRKAERSGAELGRQRVLRHNPGHCNQAAEAATGLRRCCGSARGLERQLCRSRYVLTHR